MDCKCGSEHCRGKLDRRDAKKEKETLAASLKRKATELLAAAVEPAPVERKVLKKRKTGRWGKGWVCVDPEWEIVRLQEDAMEKGKTVDLDAISRLKREARSHSRSVSAEPAQRSASTASVSSKASSTTKTTSSKKGTVITETEVDDSRSADSAPTKSSKTKDNKPSSVLSRAASKLKSSSSTLR